MNIKEITEELEVLIANGSGKITEFKESLKRFIIEQLTEASINERKHNIKLEGIIKDLAEINQSLKINLLHPNDLDIEELKDFIEIAQLDRNTAIKILQKIFKSKKCDDEDKETAHKNTANYDQLVTEYNQLLYKLSLKNIQLRQANVNNELILEFIKGN